MSPLTLSATTLIPGPTTQHFMFGERALLLMFRGGGGLLGSLLGSDESGVDVLNTRLQMAFPDYYWTSQVFDSFEGNIFDFNEIGSTQGNAFIDQSGKFGALGLIGYSAGGLSSIRIANAQAPQTVDLLVQIDSYDPLTGKSPEDEVLPDNVEKGINYYQNANNFNFFRPDFELFDLQGAKTVEGSENINAEEFLDDPSITHLNIDVNAELQTEILSNIEEFVLQDLTFDAANQLVLEGGAQFVNNILSLSSGTASAPGRSLIAQPLTVTPDFSFNSQFEFRLDPTTAILPGFSFVIHPDDAEQSGSPLEIALSPSSSTDSLLDDNTIAILTPNTAPALVDQAIAPFDLDSNLPLTAWVDYDGLTDQLSVFLSDTLIQPNSPVLATELDLFELVGSEAQFGFQATVSDDDRQADILTWQLQTTENDLPAPNVVPDTYLNLGLTQRTASQWLGFDLPFFAFEVGGLDFSTLFDEAFYLQFNPDVLTSLTTGNFLSGYDHFTQIGWLEGRAPSSLYDEAFYLAANPDVEQAIDDGLLASGFEHFVQSGHLEERNPSALFNQGVYSSENADVMEAIAQGDILSAFEHYIEHGAAEGRNPQQLLFQEDYYLTQYPDVATAVIEGAFADGFDHYLSVGCREGRNPSSFFDEAQYLSLNSDVATAVDMDAFVCGWQHYLLHGRFEGRSR
ncbi:hypothetical protein PN498_16695 [Oscillatoria sp. CS-180]|nr:hypothetical protein [Oscillatoria sp. CS-180]